MTRTPATPPAAIPMICGFVRAAWGSAVVVAGGDVDAVVVEVAEVVVIEGGGGVSGDDLAHGISFAVEVGLGLVWNVAEEVGLLVFEARDDEVGVILDLLWVLLGQDGSSVYV